MPVSSALQVFVLPLLRIQSLLFKLSTLEKGTVIPKDVVETSKGGEHIYTWTIAYNIEGIRDWLFSQSKSKKIRKSLDMDNLDMFSTF